MGFSYNVNVLNQKGSPALYTDIFANRPAAGYQGRLFVSTDTAAIYEDTGTAWTLIANVSSGAGTLQQVTTNGNTSNVGIVISAGGLSTDSLTDTGLTSGSVTFAGTGGLISQDNTNLFWDDTNNRLGINTNTPGNSLDVHTAGTNPTIAINNTAGNQSAISFLNTSVAKWRIGNTASNNFDVHNFANGLTAISISGTNNAAAFNANILIAQSSTINQLAGYNAISGDSAGIYFFLGTSANRAYFALNGLTGPQNYTLPNATGTLALTSNLASYLPLSGGTLTGALNGTSANFSTTIQAVNAGIGANPTTETLKVVQNVTDNDFAATFSNTTANPNGIKITTNSGAATTYPLAIYPLSGGGLFLKNNSRLGVGTSNPADKLHISNNGNEGIEFGFNSGSSYIISYNRNLSTYIPLILQQGGGNVLIGTSTDVGGKLNVNGGVYSTGTSSGITFIDRTNLNYITWYSTGNLTYLNNSSTGNISQINNSTGVYTPLSDVNKKKDFELSTIGLNAILGLKPTLYRMKSEHETTDKHLGFIAQEVKEFIPQSYIENGKGKDKFIGLDYQAITTTLVKAMQEQQIIIDSLLKRIEALENK
jgi:hypothetical protein